MPTRLCAGGTICLDKAGMPASFESLTRALVYCLFVRPRWACAAGPERKALAAIADPLQELEGNGNEIPYSRAIIDVFRGNALPGNDQKVSILSFRMDLEVVYAPFEC